MCERVSICVSEWVMSVWGESDLERGPSIIEYNRVRYGGGVFGWAEWSEGSELVWVLTR